MIAKLMLGALFSVGVACSAQAEISIAPLSAGAAVTRVAENCGPGFWRGPQGHCHPFAAGRACPVGYHLGPEGHKCWPN